MQYAGSIETETQVKLVKLQLTIWIESIMKLPSKPLTLCLCLVVLICTSAVYLVHYTNPSFENLRFNPVPMSRMMQLDETVPNRSKFPSLVSLKEILLDYSDREILQTTQRIEPSRPVAVLLTSPIQVNVPISVIMKGPLIQDDPRILNYIRDNNVLVPPSSAPYNLSLELEGEDPSMGQSLVVRKIFKEMKNGFFVECGALDGETRSNSLVLERDFGWKGLLIEGDPKNVELLLEKHRKAWVAKACLATFPYPHEVFFKRSFNKGKILSSNRRNRNSTSNDIVQVQCFPLFSLLSALNVTVVDYLSLDVEGHELKVLQTIPFDQILIKVLSVEYIHSRGGAARIEEFMSKWGYRVVSLVTSRAMLANDIILVHSSVDLKGTIAPIHT